jgi:predicted Fe-S protein YdhL (DUF1289 family)
MDRVVRRFTSFEEATRAEREEWGRMTPDERLDVLRVLRLQFHGEDCPDIRETEAAKER